MKLKLASILFIILVILVAVAAYFYQQVTVLKDPEALARQEAEALVAEVGAIILLPQDELPTIATVSDPSGLADQPFFAKAKVGDKVLLYPKAGKAYLFDPVAHKILEVAPINLGDVSNSIPESDGSSASGTVEEGSDAPAGPAQ